MNAIGGGAAPDLRFYSVILDREAFKAVVKDGALKLNGMPPSPQLMDDELAAIRDYLRALAKQAVRPAAPTTR